MNLDSIDIYYKIKHKIYIDFPFGDIPVCYKLNGKIVAQLYPNSNDFKITLKCDPDIGLEYRQKYKDIVVRGYHCPPVQQPYFNTVYIDKIDDETLKEMIDHSYEQVFKSFSKRIQHQILEDDK